MPGSRLIDYQGADGWPLYATAFGSGPLVVLMHGGGPDHRSLIPLAEALADRHTAVLPDVRGYGRSTCADPARHTWDRYASDVIALLDRVGIERATVGGTGMGGTIALRAALAHPGRVEAVIVISLEDIEDDAAKAAETALMDRFADRVRADGLAAAWDLFLPDLQPLIAALVQDAIPRADPASAAAAAAIGRDRSFRAVEDLAAIDAPVLLVPGGDPRHPPALAVRACDVLPRGQLAPGGITPDLRTARDLADAIAPAIRRFLAGL